MRGIAQALPYHDLCGWGLGWGLGLGLSMGWKSRWGLAGCLRHNGGVPEPVSGQDLCGRDWGRSGSGQIRVGVVIVILVEGLDLT